MIEIKTRQGDERLSVTVSDKAIYHKELMAEEYVLLTFDTASLVDLHKGDYIETDYGNFEIWKVEKPKRNVSGNGGWHYEQKFHASWAKWANRLMLYNRQNGAEKSWQLTQLPQYFMQILVGNISAAGFGDYNFAIDPALTEMKHIEFDGEDIISALTKIAETWETEWWIEGVTIHLSKCEYGEPVKLELGDELSDIDPSDGQDKTYFTRLYAFGAARNLPTNYRKTEDSDQVIEAIVERRLKLPQGIDHVDAWENMADEDVVEGIAFFDKVYPRRVGTINSISTKQYTETVTDSDGNTETKRWNAFRFTDSGITFKQSYILPTEELRITFQTGALAGMDFAVKFNPDGADENTPNAQLWEIVRNEDYGVDLPSDDFHPAIGDEYVLYGYNTQMVSDLLIPAAEQELLAEARKCVAERSKDTKVYTCPTNPVRCSGYTLGVDDTMNYDAAKEIDLEVGQVVTLVNDNYFESGSRVSRIRKFEKRLDNPFVATYEVGETAIYSRSEELNEKVDTLTYQSKEFISTGGSNIYVIKRYDTTVASDFNVFSALRAKKEFLSKLNNDEAQGHIVFREGLTAIAKSIFEGGAEFGAFVKSLYAGTGAGIDRHGNAEFESVRVRSTFEALELIVNRLSAIEGDQLLTEADTIESVDDLGNNCYGLHLRSKWDGYFTAQAENNVLKGIINTLAQNTQINANQGTSLNQNGTDTAANYYTSWMRVNSVNAAANYIEVTLYPDDEVPSGQNFPPCEMMKIARWGNQTDKQRQKCLYLSSTEGRIVKLTGVTKPIIDDWKSYGATFGELPEFLYDYFYNRGTPIDADDDYIYARGLIVQDLIFVDRQGRPVVNIVDRGQYDPAANYYCEAINPDTGVYETSDVWFMGCKWRCCKNLPISAPAWNNTDWAMIEGNPEFTVDFADTDLVFDPNNFDVTLTIIAKLYNIDITTDILDSDVEWTRYSEDADGVPRIASDNIWAINRANSGKSIHLTTADCDFLGYIPKVLRFTATVTLRDGMTPVTQAQAIFERSTP